MIRKGSLCRFELCQPVRGGVAPLFAEKHGMGSKKLHDVPDGAIVMTLQEPKSSYYSYPGHWIIYDDMIGWVAGWLLEVPESEQGL